MLNTVSIMGRLTDDPELKTTPSRVDVALFTIACERDFTGISDKKTSDYVQVVARRGMASFVCKNFHKGDMIVVDGRLQNNVFLGHNKLEINANNVYFCGDKSQSERNEPHG